MAEVTTRQKEIMYSSRTRAYTNRFRNVQRLRRALSALLKNLPPEMRETLPEVEMLDDFADHKVYNLVHLIYRSRGYEGDSKDYEFSKMSMQEHWGSGYNDTVRTLRHPEIFERPTNPAGLRMFDLANDGRE